LSHTKGECKIRACGRKAGFYMEGRSRDSGKDNAKIHENIAILDKITYNLVLIRKTIE